MSISKVQGIPKAFRESGSKHGRSFSLVRRKLLCRAAFLLRPVLPFIAAAVLFLTTGPLYAEPRLDLSPAETDFGTVSPGETVSGSFTLKNSGTEEAKFLLQPSCDCLVADPSQGVVGPGGSIKVKYRFDTTGYSGRTEQHITVYTSLSLEETPAFSLRGVVEKSGITESRTGGSEDSSPQPDERTDGEARSYGTGFSLESLEELDGTAYITYTNCQTCMEIFDQIRAWAEARGMSVVLYPLENEENKASLYELTKTLGSYPELPLLWADGELFYGKAEIRSFLEGKKIVEDRRIRTLNAVSIFLVGLLDGVNPCAFTVIILLISYLTMQVRGMRKILISGIVYVSVVFITYYLVGLGFFEAFRGLQAFRVVSKIFHHIITAALFVLAGLSLYDFLKARRGKEGEMLLKLPAFLQNSIRKNIRAQTKGFRILIGSVVLGFLISLFELACTGQVYIPVIAYMVQTGSKRTVGMGLLSIYNIGFILPLTIIFILVYKGIGSQKIGNALKNRIPAVKLGFVVMFIIFGVLNILL